MGAERAGEWGAPAQQRRKDLLAEPGEAAAQVQRAGVVVGHADAVLLRGLRESKIE